MTGAGSRSESTKRPRYARGTAAVLVMAGCLAPLAPAHAYPGATELVSVGREGQQADSNSSMSAVSADGRFVAFVSWASNLVAGDTNRASDVFVRDLTSGVTERVSVATSGAQADFGSLSPAVSANGRFVAFESFARNLVPGDTNGVTDIFVHDRQTRTTERVSVDSAGNQAGGVTAAHSGYPAISADGLVVAFESMSSTLVPGDTNAARDVFVRDRRGPVASTVRVSVDSFGAQAVSPGSDSLSPEHGSRRPAISGDGLVVAFESDATNLVVGDRNLAKDVFVHDRATGATTRASVSSDAAEGNGASVNAAISADGLVVAFDSSAANLVSRDTNGREDVFVHQRRVARTERASVDSWGKEAKTGFSKRPALSDDGRFVAFESTGELVFNDPNHDAYVADVFLRDRATATTSQEGVKSLEPAVSGTGGLAVFHSALPLVEGDKNGYFDIFAHVVETATAGAPEVSAITPAEGPTTGGTGVVISGSHFIGASAVHFGEAPAAYYVVDHDHQIRAVAPSHPAGSVDVMVTNADGKSVPNPAARFTFRAPPKVSGMSPSEGPTAGGTTVVITGSAFSGASAVRFGDVAAARFTVDADDRITAVTPAHAEGDVVVSVTTTGGVSQPETAAVFTFRVPPTIAEVSPREGPTAGGTTVVISGSGFLRASAVRFGDVASATFVIDADDRITAVTPAHAAADVAVTVTTAGGTSSASAAASFSFRAPPSVAGLTPNRGPTEGGTTVVISGSGFSGARAVRFGDVAAASFMVDADDRITAVSPPHTKGDVSVTVTTAGGASARSSFAVFTYFGKG